MHDWLSLVYHGDEWFVSYACVPSGLPSVVTFSVGHAVELYLKGTHTKVFGDIQKAINFGHNVKDLWDACKGYDKNFMPDYEIRDSVFASDVMKGTLDKRLSKDDQMHLLKNHTLYIVAKYLPDLKYLGVPMKTHKGPYALGYVHPDPYWIGFFKDMRSYLGYPPKDRADFIEQQLDMGDLPGPAIRYLQGLYA